MSEPYHTRGTGLGQLAPFESKTLLIVRLVHLLRAAVA